MVNLNDYDKLNFKEVEPSTMKFEKEGDSIMGVLLAREPRTGDTNSKYFLDTKDKGKVLVWGSMLLDERMALIPDGSVVRITFKEKKPLPKGKSLNIFKVEVADPK